MKQSMGGQLQKNELRESDVRKREEGDEIWANSWRE